MMPLVPKVLTSGAKADGRSGKQDFVSLAERDACRCPAGETLRWWSNRVGSWTSGRDGSDPGLRAGRRIGRTGAV